jgi:hypothetical protein
MKDHSIELKEECKHHYTVTIKYSLLCREITCNKCGDVKILKGYKGRYKNIVIFNELFYYRITEHILKKAEIKNIIPYRKSPAANFIIYDNNKEELIDQYSCLIDNIGQHIRITLANENRFSSESWPGWIYWIDEWVSRLDCSGDTNMLMSNEGQIIPIDFNVICTWADDLNPNYHPPEIFKIKHFLNIYDKKIDYIKDIIFKIEDVYLINLIKKINKDNIFLCEKEEQKYIDGLIIRKKIIQQTS